MKKRIITLIIGVVLLGVIAYQRIYNAYLLRELTITETELQMQVKHNQDLTIMLMENNMKK